MQQDKDRGSHWLIRDFGQAILKLAGVVNVAACTAVKNELVAPRRYPDGLLELTFTDRPARGLYLAEIETYASADADRQMFENLMVIAADRRQLPEAVTLVLRPRGNARVTGRHELSTPGRGTVVHGNWRVVEIWTLNATDLLGENDVGLIPWVPLAHMDRPADEVLRTCRERIDRDAPATRREGLLAVTQIMARLARLETKLMNILKDDLAESDSPWLQDLLQRMEQFAERRVENRVTEKVSREAKHSALVEAILGVLVARFQTIPADISGTLAAIPNDERLAELNRWAAVCPDIDAFRSRLPQS